MLLWLKYYKIKTGCQFVKKKKNKYKKLLLPLQLSYIRVAKFKKIKYCYIWFTGAFKYIPTLIVTKEGRWLRDNETYSYND